MATGGFPEDSIQYTSDEIFDHVCTICEENGRTAEARSCCNTCKRLLCDPCKPRHGGLYPRHVIWSLAAIYSGECRNIPYKSTVEPRIFTTPIPGYGYQAKPMERYDVKTTNEPRHVGTSLDANRSEEFRRKSSKPMPMNDPRHFGTSLAANRSEELKCNPSKPMPKNDPRHVDKSLAANRSEEVGSKPLRPRPRRPRHFFSGKPKSEANQYNLRTMKDKGKTPRITGVCVLSDGNIVVVDKENSKIKLLNDKNEVIDEHKLSSEPRGLCHIVGSEVAVTLSEHESKHKIKFFNVIRKNITRTRKVKLDHSCSGITYCNGQLYVCGGMEGLFVHDMDGTNRGTLFTGGWVRDVAVSPDGQLVYVTVNFKGLFVLNKDGTVLSNLTDVEIKGESYVAIAGNNMVFVACCNSNKIIQVDRRGSKKMDTLATVWYSTINNPQMLCVSYKTNELIVCQNSGILAIKIKETFS